MATRARSSNPRQANSRFARSAPKCVLLALGLATLLAGCDASHGASAPDGGDVEVRTMMNAAAGHDAGGTASIDGGAANETTDAGHPTCRDKSGRACTMTAADSGTASDDDAAPATGLPPACDGGVIREGDVVVSTASDLEALRGVACVTGNLAITQVAAIADLEPLTALRWVGGAFEISYCNELVSLVGLEQLSTVVGSLDIDGNMALADVSALDGLTSAGTVLLYEEPALQQVSFANLTRAESFTLSSTGVVELDGLGQLQQLDALYCLGNPALIDITGFAKLSMISNVEVKNNPVLTDLQAFPVLEQLSSDLSVSGNAQLATIAGFEQLHDLGQLELENNAALQVLTGFSHVQHVVGVVTIRDNAALSDISGFEALSDVGRSVVIQHNNSLANVSGFGSLTNIGATYGEDLSILANPALTSISGFSALHSVGGMLQIQDHGVLASIAGLNSGALLSVGSVLSILGNPKLSRCEVDVLRNRLLAAATPFSGTDVSACNAGCTQCTAEVCTGTVDHTSGQSLVYTGDADITGPGLTNAVELTGNLVSQGATTIADLSRLAKVDGQVSISASTLQSLDGLAGLREIGSTLSIYDNDALLSLDGLSSLEHVHDGVSFSGNTALTSIDGLNALLHVDGPLFISENPSLSAVTGLSSLQAVGELHIERNAALANIDGLVAGALTSVSGSLKIIANPSLSRCRVDAFAAKLAAAQPGLAGSNDSSANRGCSTCSAQACVTGDGTTDGQSGVVHDNVFIVSDASVYRYVTEITGSLAIYSNAPLTNLDALQNLTTVGGSITIQSNATLTNIDGIIAGSGGALTSVAGTVTVARNAGLTECAANALVSALQSYGFTQAVDVAGNLTCSTSCAATMCL